MPTASVEFAWDLTVVVIVVIQGTYCVTDILSTVGHKFVCFGKAQDAVSLHHCC